MIRIGRGLRGTTHVRSVNYLKKSADFWSARLGKITAPTDRLACTARTCVMSSSSHCQSGCFHQTQLAEHSNNITLLNTLK